jgi:hypothetical protein
MGEDPFEGNWRQYLDPDNDGLPDEESYEDPDEDMKLDSCGKRV